MDTGRPPVPVLVLMGTAGCGKSSVASEIHNLLRCDFIEGDQLHPKENVDKMSRGNQAGVLRIISETGLTFLLIHSRRTSERRRSVAVAAYYSRQPKGTSRGDACAGHHIAYTRHCTYVLFAATGVPRYPARGAIRAGDHHVCVSQGVAGAAAGTDCWTQRTFHGCKDAPVPAGHIGRAGREPRKCYRG